VNCNCSIQPLRYALRQFQLESGPLPQPVKNRKGRGQCVGQSKIGKSARSPRLIEIAFNSLSLIESVYWRKSVFPSGSPPRSRLQRNIIQILDVAQTKCPIPRLKLNSFLESCFLLTVCWTRLRIYLSRNRCGKEGLGYDRHDQPLPFLRFGLKLDVFCLV